MKIIAQILSILAMLALVPVFALNRLVIFVTTKIQTVISKIVRRLTQVPVPISATTVSEVIQKLRQRFELLPSFDSLEFETDQVGNFQIAILAPVDTKWLKDAGNFPNLTDFLSSQTLKQIGMEMFGKPLRLCSPACALAAFPRSKGSMIPVRNQGKIGFVCGSTSPWGNCLGVDYKAEEAVIVNPGQSYVFMF